MKPDRWQHVERLYHAALERAPDAREAFLSEASAGDEGLRREVESLLEYEGQAENFIEAPALEVAAQMMAKGQSAALAAGQAINHYKIISALAPGGMGEVYLAEDTRLRRRVAIKMLPARFTHDNGRLRRFELEARAVAALSHPNVCAIHELVDTGEQQQCIVMEYVEGVTLRQRMKGGRMNAGDALDIVIQIASALAAAHEAGIIHRDVKPENIMLRRDRIVKVLDFGLAKLTEQEALAADFEARTVAHFSTEAGVVLGTVSYMSPEQARGLPVDARTDIWSLGVVLYEMLAGRQPFDGATQTDVIISIAEREPLPIARFAPEVPIQLERIAQKALTKDREERYHTAEDLLIDLKSLRHRLEIDVELSNQSIQSGRSATITSNDQATTSRLFLSWLTRSHILNFTAVMGILMIVVLASWLFLRRSSTPAPPSEIKSLAVLPLKSLNPKAGDDYLGLGIADTIITKVSQVGSLTVRPTSAVRQYADREIDSLEAARELQTDSVLDGTFLQVGDRLRVSVNLLRVQDGASLWADSFDMRFTDIFTIQDEVSKEVAARLRLKLSSAEQTRLAKHYTTNPEAYSYYTKAMYHFSKRGFSGDPQEEADAAIDLFKKAVELDSSYALAHAQLGYAYAWIADFKEAGPGLIASAKEELRVAERLDPQLAEVHVARCFIAWSQYEGWQIESAIREAHLAKQLDPRIPDQVLGAVYFHVGLEEQSAKEFERAMEQDPTSDIVKRSYESMYSTLARPDEWLALHQRLFNGGPNSRYYLEKRMLKEAAPLIEQEYVQHPDDPDSRREKALLLALQGKHREAQAAVPQIMEKVRRDKAYHHYTYDIARIYALDGKGDQAMKWLRVTVNEGFPCYPLFARDSFLDPIRKNSAFIEFMTEMKTRWEGYRREFG